LNDIHLPFEDRPVLNLVLNFLKDLKPTEVVLAGDVVDCYAFSKFDKEPFTATDIGVEVDLSEKLMKVLKKITEDVTWIGGNHEDRFRKFIWKNSDIFSKLGEKKGLRVADWCFPKLFGLDELEVKWLEYKDGVTLGKLYVTHGEKATKYATAQNLDKYKVSNLTGHSHRIQSYSNTSRAGEITSWMNGCLCDLNPEYAKDPDWQQAFAIVTVDKDDTFNVQQIRILRNEKRGKPYFYYGKDRIRG